MNGVTGLSGASELIGDYDRNEECRDKLMFQSNCWNGLQPVLAIKRPRRWARIFDDAGQDKRIDAGERFLEKALNKAVLLSARR